MPSPPRPVYALAIVKDDRFEYLRRGASRGNLLRTADPFSAWAWDSVEEIVLWLDALPDGAKAQVADRKLLVVSLTVQVGAPVRTVTLVRKTVGSSRSDDGSTGTTEMTPIFEKLA